MPFLASILEHIPPALLVVFRIGGLTIFGPVFGSSAVPARVKVFLSFTLGLAIYPVIAAQQPAEAVDGVMHLSLWLLAPLIASELLIGLLIGFIASLPLMAAQTGGLIMGQQMGLGFASFFSPAIDDEADILGQVLFYLALAGFLAIGGHEAMIAAVLGSFKHIPLGQFASDEGMVSLCTGVLISSLELALRVSAPLLALIFLESVALGFISKTVPQLNILSLGFPMRILVGLTIVALGLVVIQEVMMDGIDSTLAIIFRWIELKGA